MNKAPIYNYCETTELKKFNIQYIYKKDEHFITFILSLFLDTKGNVERWGTFYYCVYECR
jgi:hypothetical protein